MWEEAQTSSNPGDEIRVGDEPDIGFEWWAETWWRGSNPVSATRRVVGCDVRVVPRAASKMGLVRRHKVCQPADQ